MMRVKISHSSASTGMFSIGSGTTRVVLDAATEDELDAATSSALTILQGLGIAKEFDLDTVVVDTSGEKKPEHCADCEEPDAPVVVAEDKDGVYLSGGVATEEPDDDEPRGEPAEAKYLPKRRPIRDIPQA